MQFSRSLHRNAFYFGLGLVLLGLLQYWLTLPRLQQGIQSYEQRDYQTAAATLQKVIERDSNNAEAYYYLGLAYNQENEYDRAIAAYQKAIDFSATTSDLGTIYYDLATVLGKTNKTDDAIAAYRKAIDYGSTSTNLGRVLKPTAKPRSKGELLRW
ncbi:tetratricopeptide repeat protein [Phormidium tenue FACHB-886]|nr:tetratricopeptide repeat protein [Phormidium tenue FACHB-886]